LNGGVYTNIVWAFHRTTTNCKFTKLKQHLRHYTCTHTSILLHDIWKIRQRQRSPCHADG